MIAFAPSDCPPNDVISYVMQSGSSIKPCPQCASVIFFQVKTDWQNRINASAKTNIGLPLPTGPYVFNIHFKDGLHDVASFFRNATYGVKISIAVTIRVLAESE